MQPELETYPFSYVLHETTTTMDSNSIRVFFCCYSVTAEKFNLLMSYMHFNNRNLSIIIHLITTPLHVCTVCGISEEFHDPWQHINYFIAVLPKNKMPKKPSSPLPSPKRGIPSSFLFFPLPSFFLYDWATHNIHYCRVAQAPKHPFCIFLCTLS